MNARGCKSCMRLIALLAVITSLAGCAHYCAEQCCPTDIRHTYHINGKVAVRQLPCGVDACGSGYKPTQWRCLQTPWKAQSPCPCPTCGPGVIAEKIGTPPAEAIPDEQDSSSDEVVPTPEQPELSAPLQEGNKEPADDSLEFDLEAPFNGEEASPKPLDLEQEAETPVDFFDFEEDKSSSFLPESSVVQVSWLQQPASVEISAIRPAHFATRSCPAEREWFTR